MLIIFEEHVLRSEGNGWHLSLHRMVRDTEPSSSLGIAGTYVRKISESVSASLSTSLISFERKSSLYKVIRARIVASCANMPK